MKLFNTEIVSLQTKEIIPNKINPNKMSTQTFNKLKLSLQKFGQLSPIIVRKKQDNFEIIDGEYRWRASKELGLTEIQAKIIEATDDEVAKLIFATTIKGKHNIYETTDIIESLVKTEDKETLEACNLDKDKIERKTKYAGNKSIIVANKKQIKDEKDCDNVKPVSKYKKLIFLVDAPKYCKVEDGEVVLK